MSNAGGKTFRSNLKIIVIGTSGTGKTSFVNKWTKGTFSDTYKATIVSEFGFKIFEDQGKLYRIQLWDLAGQDQNATITKIFAKDAHGCIVMSDATNISTRDSTLVWKSSVDEAAVFIDGGKLPCVLVENKCDLLPEDSSENGLKEFAEKNEFIGSFRASAKVGTNINESMDFLIRNIIKRLEDMSAKGNTEAFSTQRKNVQLDPEKHPTVQKGGRNRKGNCCN